MIFSESEKNPGWGGGFSTNTHPDGHTGCCPDKCKCTFTSGQCDTVVHPLSCLNRANVQSLAVCATRATLVEVLVSVLACAALRHLNSSFGTSSCIP